MSYRIRISFLLILMISTNLLADENKLPYKRKFPNIKFISREELIYAKKKEYGEFFVLDNELLITGIESTNRGSSSYVDGKNTWFNKGEKNWRQVKIESLLPYDFHEGEDVFYFSFNEKVKHYILKDFVNINMIKNDLFGDEGEKFYRSFYIHLNDKGVESHVTNAAEQVDSFTGLAYIGNKFLLNSSKTISPKEKVVGLDDPTAVKALDAINDFRSKSGWRTITSEKIIIRDYGLAQIISFQNMKGSEYATSVKIDENIFADISDYSSNITLEGKFNVIKAGEFIPGALVLVFGASGLHGCIKLAVIKDGEIIIFNPKCDITGGC